MTDQGPDRSSQKDVALELGRLSIALSFFDRNLAPALSRISGQSLAQARDALAPIRVTSERIKRIRKAIDAAGHEEHPVTAVLDLRMEVAERRNRLMHDVWAVADGQYVIWLEHPAEDYLSSFRPTPVRAAELAAMTASIQEASHTLMDWIWSDRPDVEADRG